VTVSPRNLNVSSRSCLGWWSQCLGLVSVSGGERLGLVSVSRFYVSCPSLLIGGDSSSRFPFGARTNRRNWTLYPRRQLYSLRLIWNLLFNCAFCLWRQSACTDVAVLRAIPSLRHWATVTLFTAACRLELTSQNVHLSRGPTSTASTLVL